MRNTELAKVFQSACEICGSSLFRRRKISKPYEPFSDANPRVIWPNRASFSVDNISASRRIPRIIKVGRLSQILDGIIRSVAVDMIYEVRGPSSVGVKPCQPMSLVVFAKEANRDVATKLLSVASNIANLLPAWWRLSPSKFASRSIIRQPMTQRFYSEVAGNKRPALIHWCPTLRNFQCRAGSQEQPSWR